MHYKDGGGEYILPGKEMLELFAIASVGSTCLSCTFAPIDDWGT